MKLLQQIVGHVQLQLIDPDGNVVKQVDDYNTDTIFAKLHTPTDLYFDLIFDKSIEDRLGPIGKSSLKVDHTLTLLLISMVFKNKGFSRSGNKYSVNFQWSNDFYETRTVYGLVSYQKNTYKLYTVFDMDDDPLEIPPGYKLSGTYEITYNRTSGSLGVDESYLEESVTKNGLVGPLSTGVSPELRAYKYIRLFAKTSEYNGVDPEDTLVVSQVAANISSSHDDNIMFNYQLAGELFYKILDSGELSAARASRYVKVYNMKDNNHKAVASNVLYQVKGYYDSPDNKNFTSYLDIVPISIYRNKEVYPFKYKFPSDFQYGIDESTFTGLDHYHYRRFEKYIGLVPRFYDIDADTGRAQFVAYLYWPDSPTLKFLVSSAEDVEIDDIQLFINGQKFDTYTIHRDVSPDHKHIIEFDLSLLTAGEGVVVFTFGNTYRMIHPRYYWKIPLLDIAGDFYGYCIPYAGMLNHSEITENYISSGIVNYQGNDVDLDFLVDHDNVRDIDVVQNTTLSDIDQITSHQYFVWVKESEFNKLAGVLDYKESKVLAVHISGYDQCYTPVYLTDSNIISFRPYIMSSDDVVGDVKLGDEGLMTMCLESPDNDHIRVDKVNREIEYLTNKFQCLFAYSSKKCYLGQPVGEDYYVPLPDIFIDYEEGNPSITVAGITYNIETVIRQTENIGNVTIQFGNDCLFNKNEYFSFPVCDAEGYVMVDKFETWTLPKVSGVNYNKVTLPYDVHDLYNDYHVTPTNNDSSVFHSMWNKLQSVEGDILDIDESIRLGEKGHTHVFTYKIFFNPEEDCNGVIELPKKIVAGSDIKYVVINDIFITDGLHAIPWVLDYGHSYPRTIFNLEYNRIFENWVIVLNDKVLKTIYTYPIEIILYVYVNAKSINELLPKELTVRHLTRALLDPGDSLLALHIYTKNDAILWESGAPFITSNLGYYIPNSVQVDEDGNIVLDKKKCTYMKLNDGKKLQILTNKTAHISFEFSLSSYPNVFDDHTMDPHYVLLDYTDSSNKGIRIIIEERGIVDVYINGTRQVSCGPLDLNRFYKLDLELNYGVITLFLDGVVVARARFDNDHIQMLSPVFYIGNYHDKTDDPTHCFNGKLKECKIYFKNLHNTSYYNELLNEYDLSKDIELSNDKIIKFTLPHVISGKIKVQDEDGNDLDFTILKDCYFGLENEDDVGNLLYVKINKLKLVEDVFYNGYIFQGGMGGNLQTLSITDTSSASVFYNYYNLSLYGPYSKCTQLSFELDLIEDLVNYPYTNVVEWPEYRSSKIKILPDSNFNAKDPEEFFLFYIKPTQLLDKGIKIGDWEDNRLRTTSYGAGKDYVNGEGILFQLPVNVNTIEIATWYNSHNMTVVPFCLLGDDEGSCAGPQIPLSVSMFEISRATGDGVMLLPSSYADLSTNKPKTYSMARGDGLLLVDCIAVNNILAYDKLDTAIWDYMYLGVAGLYSITTDNGLVKHRIYADKLGEKELNPSAQTKRLLLTDNTHCLYESLVFKIKDKKVIESNNISVKSYYVDDFESLFPYYKNYVGNHILTRTDKDIDYHWYNSLYTSYRGSTLHSASYMMVKDEEFLNLIKSNKLILPAVSMGYVDDSYETVVPKGTEITDMETNTLVICKSRVNYFWENMYGPGAGGYETLINTYKNPMLYYLTNNSYDLYRDHLLSFVSTKNLDYVDLRYLRYANERISHPTNIEPPFFLRNNEYGVFALMLDEHYRRYEFPRKLYESQTRGYINNYIVFQKEIEKDAIITDVRIYPKVNSYANIIYDPNKIPLNKVVDFGMYSITGLNTGAWCYVIPILKINNETEGTSRYFIVNKLGKPYEVTSYLAKDPPEEDFYKFLYVGMTNLQTFEPFNILLDQFQDPNIEYTFQYGWVIYGSYSSFGNWCYIKSITVQPIFNDDSLYKTINYAFYNEKLDILTDDKTEITTGQYEVKIKNVTNQALTNNVIRLDLTKYDLSSFTNGIMLYDANNNSIPCVMEIDEAGHVGNEFINFTGYVWVKIPNIDANETLSLEIRDETNIYNANDVFDVYYDFDSTTQFLQDWELFGNRFDVEDRYLQVQDYVIGNSNISSRLIYLNLDIPNSSNRIIECRYKKDVDFIDNSLVISSDIDLLLKSKFQLNGNKRTDIIYQARPNVKASLELSQADREVKDEIKILPHTVFAKVPEGVSFLLSPVQYSKTCLSSRYSYWEVDLLEGKSLVNDDSNTSRYVCVLADPTPVVSLGRSVGLSDRYIHVCNDSLYNVVLVRIPETDKFKHKIYMYFNYQGDDNFDNDNVCVVYDYFNDLSYTKDKFLCSYYEYKEGYIDAYWLCSKYGLGNTKEDLVGFGEPDYMYDSHYIPFPCHIYVRSNRIHSQYQTAISLFDDNSFTSVMNGHPILKTYTKSSDYMCPIRDYSEGIGNERLKPFATYKMSSDRVKLYYYFNMFTATDVDIEFHTDEIKKGNWIVNGEYYKYCLPITIRTFSTYDGERVVPIKVLDKVLAKNLVFVEYDVYTEASDGDIYLDLTFDKVVTKGIKQHGEINPIKEVYNIGKYDGNNHYIITTDLKKGSNKFDLYYDSYSTRNNVTFRGFGLDLNKRPSEVISDFYLSRWIDMETFLSLDTQFMSESEYILPRRAAGEVMFDYYSSVGHGIPGIGVYTGTHNLIYRWSEAGWWEEASTQCIRYMTDSSIVSTSNGIQDRYRIFVFGNNRCSVYGDYKLSSGFSNRYNQSFICNPRVWMGVFTSNYFHKIYTGGSHHPLKYLTIHPMMQPYYINLITYNQSGSWLDGYNKRTQIEVYADYDEEDAQVVVPNIYTDGFHDNIRVWKVGEGKYYALHAYDTLSSPIICSLWKEDNKLCYHIEPQSKSNWIYGKPIDRQFDLQLPDNYYIIFNISLGGVTDGFKLHVIRQYVNDGLVQIKNDDVSLVFENKYAHWYLIDFNQSSPANKSALESAIDSVKNKNRSYELGSTYIYRDFDDLSEIRNIETCHGALLKYNLDGMEEVFNSRYIYVKKDTNFRYYSGSYINTGYPKKNFAIPFLPGMLLFYQSGVTNYLMFVSDPLASMKPDYYFIDYGELIEIYKWEYWDWYYNVKEYRDGTKLYDYTRKSYYGNVLYLEDGQLYWQYEYSSSIHLFSYKAIKPLLITVSTPSGFNFWHIKDWEER